MRMGDIQASFGIEQLKKLDKFNKKRNINANFFDKNFITHPLNKYFQTTIYDKKTQLSFLLYLCNYHQKK